jgi:ubiquinone/menaquinone biosynthesis C-methylase UbiE
MAPATTDRIREVNIRYHDLAAADYDAKWGIDYGEAGQTQVTGKLAKALGGEPGRYERALEIGAGTGYFTLNLLRAGLIGEAVAADISPGMLAMLSESAGRLGLDVRTIRCEADKLPFADDSFDLVFGHAVLHHLPDLDAAFAEFRRVLRPGGTLAFCGEPSRYGDLISQVPKRAAVALAPAWRRLMRATKRDYFAEPGEREEADLEWLVDVHAFTPRRLGTLARDYDFEEVRVAGEELTATWFGWMNRTLEATAEPEGVPWLWRQYAYRGYLTLQALDRAVLERRLPAAIFYNLLISARKPVSVI